MKARHGVVHFFATVERGGAELRTLELLRALGTDAGDHRVVTLARRGGALRDEFERIGVETVFLRAKSAAFPWRMRRVVGDAAVFHSEVGLVGGPVLALGWLLRVPVRIAHFHSDSADGARTWRARAKLAAFRWLVHRFATHIVGVSPGSLTFGYRVDWQGDPRCRVMLSGLDLSAFEGVGAGDAVLARLIGVAVGTPVIVHVGRDHEAKNRMRALDVFARVLASSPTAHLAFVGRNEVATQRAQAGRADELGIADNVHWLGERHDVPDLLRDAAVTLMTSTREGLPGAMLESVAAGTPVVASDLPGVLLLAEHFPEDVEVRGLSASDDVWAHDVLAHLAEPRSEHQRSVALDRVRDSPFDLERCLPAFRAIWTQSTSGAASTSRRRNVVHLFSSLEPGGAELRTLELFRCLRAEGSAFDQVVFQTGTPGVLTSEFMAAGARVITQRFRTPAFWVRLVRELSRRRTTVLHLHVNRGISKPALLLPLAAALQVPIRVAHFRSDSDLAESSDPLRRVAERGYRRLIDRLATDIIGVSPAALGLGWRSDWESDPRCRVVLSGLPLTAFDDVRPRGALQEELGLARDTPLVLHVGRGVRLKNRRRAVEVFAETHVSAGLAEPHLVFVGRSDAQVAQEDAVLVAALGVQDRVHVLGQRDDVAQLMADAALLLLTSTQEGLPGVLVEALAVGTPAVASDLPGTRYVAELLPGVRIIGLDEGSDVWAQAVADSMGATDDSERERLRLAVRQSPFDVAHAAEAMTQIWTGHAIGARTSRAGPGS